MPSAVARVSPVASPTARGSDGPLVPRGCPEAAETCDAMACVRLQGGVVSGRFVLDVPTVARSMAQAVSIFAQELGRQTGAAGAQACRSATTGVVDGVWGAARLAQDCAWYAARVTVTPVARLWLWPVRTALFYATPAARAAAATAEAHDLPAVTPHAGSQAVAVSSSGSQLSSM